MSQFVNFTESELSTAAGADPWKLNHELQAGDAGAINALADAFHQSGMHVKEADDEFEAAKRQFKDAYQFDGVTHPIRESAVVQQASKALAGHPEELSRIAVDLEKIAVALAIAQRDSDAEIAALDAKLNEYDDQLTAVGTDYEFADLFKDAAKEATKAAVEQIQGLRGAYIAELNAAEAAMMASGYVPDVIDNIDGVEGNTPSAIAERYEKSGQRVRDQALVDKAKSEGRTAFYMPGGQGSGRYMTREEGEALARLNDYTTIADPAHDYHHSPDERDQASQLAGQRLDDYMVANSSGSVPKDPVLGGDARTRAQARLQLQHDLQYGQLAWHREFTGPDEATRLMNDMEAADRVSALAGLREQLQQAGMTTAGAAQVAEDMSHGILPKELVEDTGSAGKVFAGGEKAFEHYGKSLPVGGWEPTAAPYSAADLETLKKIGGKMGVVGNIVDLGVFVYEINHGVPVGEAMAKTGGGAAGAWAMGVLGAEIGAIGGPPGVFLGALVGASIGGFVGESVGQDTYKWATGA